MIPIGNRILFVMSIYSNIFLFSLNFLFWWELLNSRLSKERRLFPKWVPLFWIFHHLDAYFNQHNQEKKKRKRKFSFFFSIFFFIFCLCWNKKKNALKRKKLNNSHKNLVFIYKIVQLNLFIFWFLKIWCFLFSQSSHKLIEIQYQHFLFLEEVS